MKRVYIINDGKYREVSKEEYNAFEGEKFIAPPHWRMMIIAEMLLLYRYM